MKSAFFIVAVLAAAGCTRQEAAMPSSASTSNAQMPSAATAEPPHHHANIKPTQGNTANGVVEFVSHGDAVQITGTIKGLEPNSEHGFHIHEKGDCSAPDGSSAGGHFNPASQTHGSPDSSPHHAGDVHNLRADGQGVAKVDETLTGITLNDSSDTDVLGKAVVVHAKADDYKSQPAGNSGSRIACGVIE